MGADVRGTLLRGVKHSLRILSGSLHCLGNLIVVVHLYFTYDIRLTQILTCPHLTVSQRTNWWFGVALGFERIAQAHCTEVYWWLDVKLLNVPDFHELLLRTLTCHRQMHRFV